MTAKRFSVNMENYVLDNVTGKGYVADNNIDANLIRDLLNEFHEENQILRHELLCKQLDKAPTEPINCKCYYEVKE